MPTNQPHNPGNQREYRISFDAEDLKPVTPYSEDLKDEFHEAQNALRKLREQEEQVRRRAEQLEEITQKEDAFTDRRIEAISTIEEHLKIFDRETSEIQHIARECASSEQILQHHLSILRNLHPDAADRSDRNLELDHALRQISTAFEDLRGSQPLVDHIISRQQKKGVHTQHSLPGRTHHSGTSADVDDRQFHGDFFYWFKAGLAFTLPLMTIVIIIAFIALFLR